MNPGTIWRVIWPERGPLFVVVGGIVSMAGDFASFLSNIASPTILVWPAVGLAGLLVGSAWAVSAPLRAMRLPKRKRLRFNAVSATRSP